jgi:16S rRNA G966 N2-methylase RsmD
VIAEGQGGHYPVARVGPVTSHLRYELLCGDNRSAVDHLQALGARVDLVYLDPPYNTGRLRGARKSFRDVSDTDWLEKVRIAAAGARQLLADSGFLAASISQLELFRLKPLLDEVFGSECFIGLFPVKIRHNKRQLMINATFHDVFEYLLLYRKQRQTRFYTQRSTPRPDQFIYRVQAACTPTGKRVINGKRVEWFGPGCYEIRRAGFSPDSLRRYVIAGKLATANWSGEWYEKHLRTLGENLLIRVWGLEKAGLGYRWFQTGKPGRRSGVYYQSQLNAGRAILPSNDLDYTEVVPTIYKEGGAGCDFKDSKKPEALLRFLLEYCTPAGGTVLDLYAGSGTTLGAALKLRRSAVLVERDPTAIEIIKARVANLDRGSDLDGIPRDFEFCVQACPPR